MVQLLTLSSSFMKFDSYSLINFGLFTTVPTYIQVSNSTEQCPS